MNYKYKLNERIGMRCVSIVGFLCAGFNLNEMINGLGNIVYAVVLMVSIVLLIGGGYWLMACSFKRYGVE
jgi:hypothetical protein